MKKIEMPCKVFRLWLSGACFVSNGYRHWSSIVSKKVWGRPILCKVQRAWRRETHFLCLPILLPFSRWSNHWKWNFLMSPSPDTLMMPVHLVCFAKIKLYFSSLKLFSPGQRYSPDPPKIILILHPDNPESRILFDLCHRFKFCTGVRYVGYFIMNDEFNIYWLE